jgi:CheY-like chemotaxis protein
VTAIRSYPVSGPGLPGKSIPDIDLPEVGCADPSPGGELPLASAQRASYTALVVMPKHRVLVIDDYPDAAETACALLTILGHECRFATCGEDGLLEAARFGPEIVILDIGLPDLSGYEVARRLRAQFAGRPLYLAAVTGWGQPEDRAKAFAAGFDHHVIKPADREKLSKIIELADLSLGAS